MLAVSAAEWRPIFFGVPCICNILLRTAMSTGSVWKCCVGGRRHTRRSDVMHRSTMTLSTDGGLGVQMRRCVAVESCQTHKSRIAADQRCHGERNIAKWAILLQPLENKKWARKHFRLLLFRLSRLDDTNLIGLLSTCCWRLGSLTARENQC